jgi:hypothetical protein
MEGRVCEAYEEKVVVVKKVVERGGERVLKRVVECLRGSEGVDGRVEVVVERAASEMMVIERREMVAEERVMESWKRGP